MKMKFWGWKFKFLTFHISWSNSTRKNCLRNFKHMHNTHRTRAIYLYIYIKKTSLIMVYLAWKKVRPRGDLTTFKIFQRYLWFVNRKVNFPPKKKEKHVWKKKIRLKLIWSSFILMKNQWKSLYEKCIQNSFDHAFLQFLHNNNL